MTMKRVFQQLEQQKKQQIEPPPHQIDTVNIEKLKTIQSQWQRQIQQYQNDYNELQQQIQLLKKKQQQCLTNQHLLKEGLSKLELDIDLFQSQIQKQ